MRMPKRLAIAVAVLVLASCGSKETDKQAQAGGEVLPGSASDAMLPLDTVTSQPPLAPKSESGPAKDKGGASEAAAEPAADSAPAEQPAQN
jgi:hypothetical protein